MSEFFPIWSTTKQRITCLLMDTMQCPSPGRPGPEVIKLFPYSTQLSIKFQLTAEELVFLPLKLLYAIFILLINVKMPTIVGILTLMSRKNSMLSCVEHENSFINSGSEYTASLSQAKQSIYEPLSLSSTSNWKFYNYYRDKFMILYYFPIAQNTVNKTVSDFFSEMYICLYVYVHIFYYFSIYWSDTSLWANVLLFFSKSAFQTIL